MLLMKFSQLEEMLARMRLQHGDNYCAIDCWTEVGILQHLNSMKESGELDEADQEEVEALVENPKLVLEKIYDDMANLDNHFPSAFELTEIIEKMVEGV